jgi:hypothetical protein
MISCDYIGSGAVHTAETFDKSLIIKRFYFVVLRLYCNCAQLRDLFGSTRKVVEQKIFFLFMTKYNSSHMECGLTKFSQKQSIMSTVRVDNIRLYLYAKH